MAEEHFVELLTGFTRQKMVTEVDFYMEKQKKLIEVVFVCLLMPVVLISNFPLLYSLTNDFRAVLIYGFLQVTLSFAICFELPRICKKKDINKWFGFALYAICVTLSSFLGLLSVYLVARHGAHPMIFEAY